MNDAPSTQVAIDGLLTNVEQIRAASVNNFEGLRALHELLLNVRDLLLQDGTEQIIKAHANPLNRAGRKCFSQAEEDGITMEILRRLGIDRGVFAEFGVGAGLENNTLILGALGWRGFWVGGEALAFDAAATARLHFTRARIDLENIVDLARDGAARSGGMPDVISVDLDGNDFYFVRALLEAGFPPRLFIVEYNAKFPPPVRFQIAYDADHRWMGDDYFGASLTSFAELFEGFGYRLVCCNAHTGSNAFFVQERDLPLFADVPRDMETLYAPPRYHPYGRYGHKLSAKVAEAVFRD